MIPSTGGRERTSPLSCILLRHPIYDGIYSRLSPGARIRFGRTCRLARKSVQDFHLRTYNINRHLKRFVDDPIAFRNLQARLAMLISGSNALQFLDSTFYPSSDLDLYVWKDDITEVGHWLMEHEGYTFAPSVFQHDDFDKAHWMREQWRPSALRAALAREPDVELNDVDDFHHQHYRFTWLHGVYSFEKDGPDGRLTVQVIAGTGGPLSTILTFHSTCVMNCIAFDAAYSLYPQATFEERRSLCMATLTDTDAAAFAKYSRRGWQLISAVWPHERATNRASFHVDATRWVADRYSWVVPLDTSELQPRPRLSSTSDYFAWDPVVYNSWRLEAAEDHAFEIVGGAAIGQSVCSTVVRYAYLIVDPGLFKTIATFLKTQGRLESLKSERLSKDERERLQTWWDATVAGIIEVHRAEQAKKQAMEVFEDRMVVD